ncbi:MAG: hypothetical protein ACOC2Z_15915 [Coleofasciculus sp.]
MTWIFKPIDNSVNRDNFDCGVPELNDYLKKYAKQNHQKGIAKTFVAIPEEGEPNVAGYYSVSMSEIQGESMPKSYGKGLPRYPVPAMRMGKLAVDSSMQDCLFRREESFRVGGACSEENVSRSTSPWSMLPGSYTICSVAA